MLEAHPGVAGGIIDDDSSGKVIAVECGHIIECAIVKVQVLRKEVSRVFHLQRILLKGNLQNQSLVVPH